MGNELAENKDFQTRMFERIREQMGSLLTDEELGDIVTKSIDKAFFEPKKTSRNFGDIRTEEPSEFVSLVREELKSRVGPLIQEWFATHSEEINKIIKDEIDKGLINIAINYIQGLMSAPMFDLEQRLRQQFNIT